MNRFRTLACHLVVEASLYALGGVGGVFVAADAVGQNVPGSFLATNCPPYASPGGVHTNTATPGTQPARCFTCGQARKYASDGTTLNQPNVAKCTSLECQGSDMGVPYVTSGSTSVYLTGTGALCGNRRIASGENGNFLGNSATEIAEIRGWIVADGDRDNGEDEWELDVLLDVGWAPAPGAVLAPSPTGITPINTVDQVARLGLTPANVVEMGKQANPLQARLATLPFPPTWQNDSKLTGDAASWGGAYAPVIHLEVDGWGPSRGYCDTTNPSCGGLCDETGLCWYDAIAPTGWIKVDGAYWPFDPRPFYVGQYVRIVGTLWKDYSHAGSIGSTEYDYQAKNNALDCWERSRPGIGWAEMHGVDLMEDASDVAPDAAHLHYLAGYAICMNTLNTSSQHTSIADLFYLGPQPTTAQPNAVIAERYQPSLLTLGFLDSPWNNNPNQPRAAVGGGTTPQVAYVVSATLPTTSADGGVPFVALNEFIDAYWNNCPAGQCPGAGSQCLSVTTSSDVNNCGACAHQCNPPLNGNGAPACSGSRCTFACAYGYCPTSTDCVATTLAFDVNNCGTCFHVCPGVANGGPTCVLGTCGLACNSGYTLCGSTCLNLSSDVNNCGACGNQCAAGYACISGRCTYQCNSTTCASGCCSGNTCEPGNQPAYGCASGGAACLTACPTNDTCSSGACVCQPIGCRYNQCGSHSNGCGGTVSCGGCPTGMWCTNGYCGCPSGTQFCDPGCYKVCP